jgi:RNA polymerase sigma factor (TIGR02999 family)
MCVECAYRIVPDNAETASGRADESDPTRRQVDLLFPAVYAELRRLAHRRLLTEPRGHTLSTTALVHEAYLKLADQRLDAFKNRTHFFALAAQAMRRILIDYARRHRAIKRSQNAPPVSLSALDASSDFAASVEDASERAEFLIALDEALTSLRALDERLALVVEYRFFGGLTEPETAEILGVTPRTVARDWVRARGWLYQHLRDTDGTLGTSDRG